ncbi:uncharacterized protein LOC142097327 isoform X1 [Mixophyes fleayi]|uniref:uncharacterized protein LOC142097327 isoform X1 n=1 Tax=Mixophyes fleayi TaxID=3061075 RepID=UPI003F4D82AC
MQSPAVDNEDVCLIRHTLSQYKPGSTRDLRDHNFRRVCLQLFGLVGHGKSSLINSCLCVVQDCHFSNEAGSGRTGKPFTMARKEYKLTDSVYIIDNRGLNQMTKDEKLEVAAQFRKLRTMGEVEWEFELERTVNQLEDRYKNQCMDFIVPVLVYSVKHTFSNVSNNIGAFLIDAFEITGIVPIVVLTNHKDQNITDTCQLFEELGAQHIIDLDNYTTTNSARNLDTDSKVLRLLNVCLQEADRGIQKKQNLDPQLEFIKKSVNQIKAEMLRQKEMKEEALSRSINEKMDVIRKKDNELIEKEQDLEAKKRQISRLNSDLEDLDRKLKMSYYR